MAIATRPNNPKQERIIAVIIEMLIFCSTLFQRHIGRPWCHLKKYIQKEGQEQLQPTHY